MMAYSTEQTPAAVSWNYEISAGESFRPSPSINHICVLTIEELKIRIISAIETYLCQNPSVLVQHWAAKEIGKTYVLTTTCQPFGRSGNNEELQTYRKACLDHKHYVYKDYEKEVAFGLPGRVFLNCTPEQTQNVHNYPTDHRPPCKDDTIFNKIWGSFAMPVIKANKCVGVLEFVTDTPKESYNNDILVVYRALELVGLQSSIQLDHPRRTNFNVRKRFRKTKSFSLTRYCCLVPYFGLSSARAAEILGLKQGAFRDLCRNVGIPVWPWIPNTTARASSVLETQIKPTVADTQTNEIAFESSDIEAWIKSERARPGFVPNFGEMEYQENNYLFMGGLRYMDFLDYKIKENNDMFMDGLRYKNFLDYNIEENNDMVIDDLEDMDCLDYNIEELINEIK